MFTRFTAAGLLILLSSASAQSPSNTATGMLEYLSRSAMVIRLQDNREIQIELPPDGPALPSDQELGDWVDVSYQTSSPMLDSGLNLMLHVALTDFHPFGKPSASEMEAAVASPIRGLPGNLLQGPTSQHTSVEPPDKVQAIRQHVKEYLLRMPAYTAVETIDRFTSAAAPPQWAPFDEIQDEVRFNGRHEVRTSISRNGRSWPAVYEALPGIKWRAGYAAKLRALFLKPDEVSFTEERPGNVNGHAAIAYIFRAPADSISHWFMGEQGYWPATEGKVWVSPQDDSVLRIDTNSTEFPTDFPLAQVTQHIVFDSVQIGSQRQVLPVTSEVMVLRRDSNKAALNRSTFRNYRLLSAIP